jgi:hypothetical protein
MTKDVRKYKDRYFELVDTSDSVCFNCCFYTEDPEYDPEYPCAASDSSEPGMQCRGRTVFKRVDPLYEALLKAEEADDG